MTREETDPQTLTPVELEIMQVLWAQGACTVGEVAPHLKGEQAYTTVQTMLNVLLRKGKVERVLEGRAYRYQPLISREKAAGSAIFDMVRRMFGGSPEAMLLSMVDNRQISPEQLEKLGRHLGAAREKEGGEK